MPSPRLAAVVSVIAVGLLGVVAPAAAQQVCFQDQFGTVYHVQLLGAAGGFGGVVGEAVFAGGADSAPLTGSGHLRANGDAHVGLTIHSAGSGGGSGLPYTVEATLAAPAYTSGTGFAVNSATTNVGTLTLSPAACPGLPAGPVSLDR